MAHGDVTTEVRLHEATGAGLGDCVEVVAPVSIYDGQTQVDVLRPEWVRTW